MELKKYEKDHISIVRKLSSECMVLLKSDGSFPLEKTGKLALYGKGARHTLKGGTGGGTVEVRTFTRYTELMGWFVIPAALLLGLEMLLRRTFLRKIP